MKVLFSNVRGLGNPDTRTTLKKLCHIHNPNWLFVSEPWINSQKVPINYFKSLNLKLFAENNRGGSLSNLWCLCNDRFSPSVIESACQHVAFSIMFDRQELFLSAVYASTSYISRRHWWNDLTVLHQNHPAPWCFIRDFNLVLSAHEYKGSS